MKIDKNWQELKDYKITVKCCRTHYVNGYNTLTLKTILQMDYNVYFCMFFAKTTKSMYFE